MQLRELLYGTGDWKAGILKFENVTGAAFNELHCTVTRSSAAVGQGFHFSSYNRTGYGGVDVPTGKIYFTYDGGSGNFVKLNSADLRFADSGALVNFDQNFHFGTFMGPSLGFYRNCFGLTEPTRLLSNDDFPPLVGNRPQPPVSPNLLPTPLTRSTQTVAPLPDFAAQQGGSIPLTGGPQEEPYEGFLASVLQMSGAFTD